MKRPEWCICSDAYFDRDLEDPQCRHGEMKSLTARVADACRLANNALYFDDSADFQGALWDICVALGMNRDEIGAAHMKAPEAGRKE